jgi:hypothetical protein
MKKSFVLYADLIHTTNKLSNEQAGELFKLILSHANDDPIQTDNLLLEVAFEPIKQQMARDKTKWEAIKIKRKEAGSLGGQAKVANASKAKQKVAKGSKAKQNLANVAVNVNDTVNVTVNDNEIVKEKTYTSTDVQSVFEFWCLNLNKNKSAKLTANRMKCIQARLKDGYTLDNIKRAIVGCSKSPYHQGQNDTGTVYDDLTLICRNGEKLEQFMGITNNKPPSPIAQPQKFNVTDYYAQQQKEWREQNAIND